MKSLYWLIGIIWICGSWVGCATAPAPVAPQEPPPIRWGYSQEHPLPMTSIPASLDYLDRLRTVDGAPIQYQRIGSVKVYTEPSDDDTTTWKEWLGFEHRPGPILDQYEITTPTQTVILWLNPYANRAPLAPPDGFSVVEPLL